MSLQKPNRSQPPFFGPALIGASLGVALSVPIAAYTAAWLGDTYNSRVMIYCGFLIWVIIGAVAIFRKTYKGETRRPTFRRILLWCISLWLWPFLLLVKPQKD